MDSVGERIRHLRRAEGISQERLSRRADVSLNVLNRIETGAVTNPHLTTIIAIADALGVSVADLVEEDRPKAQAPSSPQLFDEGIEERRGDEVRALLERAGVGDSPLGLDREGFKRFLAEIPERDTDDLVNDRTRADWLAVVKFVDDLPEEARTPAVMNAQGRITTQRQVVFLKIYNEILERRDIEKAQEYFAIEVA